LCISKPDDVGLLKTTILCFELVILHNPNEERGACLLFTVNSVGSLLRCKGQPKTHVSPQAFPSTQNPYLGRTTAGVVAVVEEQEEEEECVVVAVSFVVVPPEEEVVVVESA